MAGDTLEEHSNRKNAQTDKKMAGRESLALVYPKALIQGTQVIAFHFNLGNWRIFV